MKVIKISQRIGRTVQISENDYIKIDVHHEAELGMVIDSEGNIVGDDAKECQAKLFSDVKEILNTQTKKLLKKK